MGLRFRHRAGIRAQGPERRHRPLHLGQEERARVDARLAPQGLSRLARDGGGQLGQARHPRDRLPGRLLLRRAQGEAQARSAWTSSIPKSSASTRSSASRSRSRRCSPGSKARAKVAVDAVFDSVSRRDHLPRGAEEGGSHLPLHLRGDPRISGAGEEIPRHGRPAARQLFRLPQQRGLLRRHLRLRARGRALPDGAVSTYFRINAENTGQFERTLIVADKGSYVSYLEGCTAPMRDENQLHAAVVEIFAHEDAEVKYSTVQNWYPGDKEGRGRHLQLRHQARARARATARRSAGPRSRPEARSPGNIRAAS